MQQLPGREREIVKSAAQAYCQTGEVPEIRELGTEKRFTVEEITVHFEEAETTVTFTNLHRFPRY